MARNNPANNTNHMKREMQEIMNSGDCEEMEPTSDSVHAGNPRGAGAGGGGPVAAGGGHASVPGRTTPPNSLAIMPDHIFGCGPNGSAPSPSPAPASENANAAASNSAKVEFRGTQGGGDGGGGGRLESPSTVLGGSTSWTGGLSHGCTAVFRNDETTATTTVPLSSPGGGPEGGTPGAGPVRSNSLHKLETIKNWTISTYKCSRQTLYEKLGKTSRTVDVELENQIESLRDTQRKYSNILRLARALTSHFYHVVHTQSALGECFGDLSNRSPELQEEFLYNAETQRNLVKNGEQLIGALNFFVSSVNTLCNKTMEDTIVTVKQYEMARVEFDAYRADLEFFSSAPKTDLNQQKQRETEDTFKRQREEFEKLRSDVQIKLKFLDENRVSVMHKQLLLFHNAVSAYFSGNQKALEATMKQFSIKLKSPNSVTPSWAEQ